MSKFIILVALVYFGASDASPNFGIAPTILPSNPITTGVAIWSTALTSLSSAIIGLPTVEKAANTNMSTIIENLNSFTKTLVAVGGTLKGNISAALSDTKTDSSALIEKISGSLNAISEYLSNDAATALTAISDIVSPSSAVEQINEQLSNVATSISNILSSFSDIDTAITAAKDAASGGAVSTSVANANIPAIYGTVINTNFTAIKNQMANITANVKAMTTSVIASNAYMTKVAGLVTSTGAALNATQDSYKKVIIALNKTATGFYSTAMKQIAADLKLVATKLAVFAPNTDLNAFVTAWTDISAAVNTAMSDQTTTGMETVNTALTSISDNAETSIQTASSSYTTAVSEAAAQLTTSMLALGTAGSACFTKYNTKVTDLLTSVKTEVQDCVTKDQKFLAAVLDPAVRIEQLGLASHTYIKDYIISCANFKTFAKDTTVFNQAKACLQTMIPDPDTVTGLYTSIVQPELDAVPAFLNPQVDVFNARLEKCLALKSSIFQAQVTTVLEGIAKC